MGAWFPFDVSDLDTDGVAQVWILSVDVGMGSVTEKRGGRRMLLGRRVRARSMFGCDFCLRIYVSIDWPRKQFFRLTLKARHASRRSPTMSARSFSTAPRGTTAISSLSSPITSVH